MGYWAFGMTDEPMVSRFPHTTVGPFVDKLLVWTDGDEPSDIALRKEWADEFEAAAERLRGEV